MDEISLIHKPLLLERGRYYLSLYNDDDYSVNDPAWMSNRDDFMYKGSVDSLPLQNSMEEALNGGSALVGRILAKSRINYYGVHRATIPFQFVMMVGDESQVVQLVVWNEVCQMYYRSMRVNDLILIENYKKKEFLALIF